MWAKAAGIVVGILVMFIYFRVIGTLPIMETLVGLLLGLVAGLFVWVVIDRWLLRRAVTRR